MAHDAAVPVDELLGRVTGHLDMLAEQVFTLERSVGETLLHNADMSDAAIYQLQALDFLRQSLEDLAVLSAVAARDLPQEAQFELELGNLTSRLKLQSTKSMLAGHATEPVRRASGELDLF